ncbi:MAG: permease-like cell division protein FtsX [Prevotellaceae bacterium]|jgi:cell division transport system permease protein|nr:permease-like cell division protein FtsX [Prevotellaceae bacterium]
MSLNVKKIVSNRLRTSYLSSVISTALVLFLLGVVGILVFNLNRLPETIRDQITVSINLKDSITNREAMRVLAIVELKEFVSKAKYKSKDETVKEMSGELGDDFIKLLDENPFPSRIEINLKSDYFSSEGIDFSMRELRNIEGVKDVLYHKSLFEQVAENTKNVSIIILIFVCLLLFISVFLISNTIRLAIYSKRFLINTMKLVGANTTFIRTPFLAASVWQGLISGFIAIFFLLGLVMILKNDFSDILELTDAKMFGTLFALMLVLGSLINFIATYIIVTRYTKIGADDLWEG